VPDRRLQRDLAEDARARPVRLRLRVRVPVFLAQLLHELERE
jgi:hypothetical protein